MLRSREGRMTARTPRGAAALVAHALLAACGSGFGLRLVVAFDAPPARIDQPTLVLHGTASLPAGSVRSGGTSAQPIVTCLPGTFSMTWTNDANGSRGAVFARWDCPADHLSWSSGAIPLSPGENRITVAMADADGSAASVVSITRE